MDSGPKLDASRGAFIRQIISFWLALTLGAVAAAQQESTSDSARLSEARKATEAGQWEEAARLAQGPNSQSADFDFIEGLALAKLLRWPESRQAGAHRLAILAGVFGCDPALLARESQRNHAPFALELAQPLGHHATRDGLPIAYPVLISLDCRAAGERALEAADAVRRTMGW